MMLLLLGGQTAGGEEGEEELPGEAAGRESSGGSWSSWDCLWFRGEIYSAVPSKSFEVKEKPPLPDGM